MTNTVLNRESYHHGDLRTALIAAAEQLLSEAGIEGFSLRGAAKVAGVSPGAPAYHFGDASGLLTEVAILGFMELNRCLDERASKEQQDPIEKLRALGEAYIQFALANEAKFLLMFRKDKLRSCAQLSTVSAHALQCLQRAICEAGNLDQHAQATRASVLFAWSVVHGFAHLAIDHQFKSIGDSEGQERFYETYVPLVLAHIKPQTLSDQAVQPECKQQ